MIGRRQWRERRIPVWILAVAGLLVLLAVAAAIHPVLAPLSFLLLPVFLLGRLEDSTRWVPACSSDAVLPGAEPDRFSLFQRPPPIFS